MKRWRTAGAVALAATMVASLGAPASGASVRVTDGDDSTMLADILRVRLTHGEKRVKVRVRFDDLAGKASRASQSMSIFLDTDASNGVPEYRFNTGLNRGNDYRLQKVRSWTGQGRHVDECDYRLKIDWSKDVAVMTVPRACLDNPRTVAVGVKSYEDHNDGTGQFDWMTARRAFSAPVPAG